MKNTVFKQEDGFTLIELMAVLAILTMLVLIAVPAIGSITKKADAQADDATISMIEKAGGLALLGDVAYDDPVEEQYEVATLVEEGYLDIDDGHTYTGPGNTVTHIKGYEFEFKSHDYDSEPIGESNETPNEDQTDSRDDVLSTTGEIIDVINTDGQSANLGFSSLKSGTYYPSDAAKDRTWTIRTISSQDTSPSEEVTISVYNSKGVRTYSQMERLSKYSYDTWTFYVGSDTKYIRVEGSPRYASGLSITPSGKRPTNYNLTASSTSDAITFNWSNMDSAVFYDGNGNLIKDTSAKTFTKSGLEPDTLYTFDIVFKKDGTGQKVTFQMKTKPVM